MSNSVCTVVLSYNGTACTIACLQSLIQEPGAERDIIVIDNASEDGAPAAIKACFPDIHLVELRKNLGWAGGNNVGIRMALDMGYDYVCLLNNDTLLPPNAIAMLAKSAEGQGLCLMHPVIRYADPSDGYQLDPRRANSTGQGSNRHQDTRTVAGGVLEMDHAYGACLVIPSALFRAIGLLDERFFLQLEETDFWMRARDVGVRSVCDTNVEILHAESMSFGARMTPMKAYYISRNTLLLTEKIQPSVKGYYGAAKSIYWVFAKHAQRNPGGGSVLDLLNFRSRDCYARAVRAGIRDYLFRRFGAISNATLRALAPRPEPVGAPLASASLASAGD